MGLVNNLNVTHITLSPKITQQLTNPTYDALSPSAALVLGNEETKGEAPLCVNCCVFTAGPSTQYQNEAMPLVEVPRTPLLPLPKLTTITLPSHVTETENCNLSYYVSPATYIFYSFFSCFWVWQWAPSRLFPLVGKSIFNRGLLSTPSLSTSCLKFFLCAHFVVLFFFKPPWLTTYPLQPQALLVLESQFFFWLSYVHSQVNPVVFLIFCILDFLS